MRKAFAALLIGWVAVFYAAPILVAVAFSFFTPRTYGGIEFTPTLENYAFSAGTLRVFGRTAVLALLTGGICALASLLIAMDHLLRPGRWKERLIVGLAVFSLITNSLMKVYAWVLILPGGDPWVATLVGMVYTYLPLALLLMYEGVRSIDPGLIRAAKDLGASERVIAWRIVWPLSRSFATGAALVVAVFVFADFLVPQVLGRGMLVLTGNRMSDLFLQQANWPGAMAIGTVVLLGLFVALVPFYLRRRET